MMQDTKKMTRRLWVLFALLSVGFSSIFLLPKQKDMVVSRLSKDLPESVSDWVSEKREVSPVEKKILAKDTEFSRRSYTKTSVPGFNGVEVSVVFSGKDINNSLHRPEVCLRAQGWNFVRQRSLVIPNVLADGSGLPVREIACIRPRVAVDGNEPPKNNQGEPVYDMLVQYYTFFGAEKIVSGHYERTFADIEARVLNGYDQQWAYTTFSVPVTSVFRDQGFDLPDAYCFDEKQSVELMRELMRELLVKVVKEPHL